MVVMLREEEKERKAGRTCRVNEWRWINKLGLLEKVIIC